LKIADPAVADGLRGGIDGIAGVLILLAGIYFGFDTSVFVDLGGGGATQASSENTQVDECAAQFVS
jgi:hypothetical protein